jgi:transposase
MPLARFFVDAINRLDVKLINASYAGRGLQAYDPEKVLALLCFGYVKGVVSSHKLEPAT